MLPFAHRFNPNCRKAPMRRYGLTLQALTIGGLLVTSWAPMAQQSPRAVDDSALRNAAKSSSDWLTVGHDYAEQRHSPLTQITAANVSQLSLAWSYEVGPGGGPQQATPLVADGVLYGITNWSIVFAVDARTGKEIWRYDPKVDRAAMSSPGKSRLCCGVNSRGVALY